MSTETRKEPIEVSRKNVEVKHPLLEFVPAIFNSFEEWLAKWNTATYLAEKLGLLHSLTIEKSWWNEERLVSFLLGVADGCDDYCNFRVDKESGGYNNTYMIDNAEKRKNIAEKAFSVLCLKFFKDGAGNEKPLWWWMLENETLFRKVLWFLRLDDGYRRRLFNRHLIGTDDSNNHQKEVFRVFVDKFARLGWKFHSMSERHHDEKTDELVRNRLVASRPQFIEILYELGELNWLNGQELDTASLKKLTKLALDQDLNLPRTNVYDSSSSYRKPISLEEAVLGGSVAAQIVLLHRIRENEQKRINALYEESKRQQQSKERQLQLNEVEAQRRKLEQKAKKLIESSDKH